jgi:hypothetical protein
MLRNKLVIEKKLLLAPTLTPSGGVGMYGVCLYTYIYLCIYIFIYILYKH